MRFLMLSALLCLCCGSHSQAQSGILYRLEPAGALRQDHCLGPCLCVYFFETGPAVGTFTLTFDQPGPVFAAYAISSVDLAAAIGSQVVTLRGSGVYHTNGVSHEMELTLDASSPIWPTPQPYTSGLTVTDPQHPFPEIGISIQAPLQGCDRNLLRLVAAPVPCQADCDASGVLSANDFMCFLNKFATGDPYANCDGSTTPPRLNANDFQCFLNRVAAGCA